MRQTPQREEAVQRQIIATLRSLGFEVQQVTVRYRQSPCSHCGHLTRPTGGYGSTAGIADLLVSHPRWGELAPWLQIEVKGTATRLSPVQRQQEARGRIMVARSASDALEGIRRFEQAMGMRSGVLDRLERVQ